MFVDDQLVLIECCSNPGVDERKRCMSMWEKKEEVREEEKDGNLEVK
jgi:hypothetical protein